VLYREPAGWLRCFRGANTLTALVLVAELRDWRRFESPRALMAYLGMVPSESSCGARSGTAGSRKRATSGCDGCSLRRPGTTGIGRA
jgi:transposase